MSDYVIHITRPDGDDEDGYGNIISICWDRLLEARTEHGIGCRQAPDAGSQRAVCFSEIPPGQWERLWQRRGTRFGLGFTREFLAARGGGPVWYAYLDTPHYLTLQRMMREAGSDETQPIWRLTPMIEGRGNYGSFRYEFEWEREWRHVGDLRFEPDDVAFLLIPEHLHERARGFFLDALHDNSGPAYLCPYLDPSWSRERILEGLAAGS